MFRTASLSPEINDAIYKTERGLWQPRERYTNDLRPYFGSPIDLVSKARFANRQSERRESLAETRMDYASEYTSSVERILDAANGSTGVVASFLAQERRHRASQAMTVAQSVVDGHFPPFLGGIMSRFGLGIVISQHGEHDSILDNGFEVMVAGGLVLDLTALASSSIGKRVALFRTSQLPLTSPDSPSLANTLEVLEQEEPIYDSIRRGQDRVCNVGAGVGLSAGVAISLVT